MDEKVLIKSEIDEKVKNILQKGVGISLIIVIFCSFLLCMEFESVYSHYHYSDIGWAMIFRFDNISCFLIFLVDCIALLATIILGVIYLAIRDSELIVTEKNVRGKTRFGKEVVLPLNMISAYSTKKFMSTVFISTSSGSAKFSLVGNYEKISIVLSQLINKRQEASFVPSFTPSFVPQSHSLDELKKLKELLDAGIITQEEFDAKKKQILGL